jgi:predicted phage tail protein
VDWADIPEGSRSTTQQAFDLTDFCTNRAQALKTARFLLSIRRRITHTVSFKTVPDALGIQPGSYIRVITAATSYSAANNGVITDAGTLVSISTIADGTYDAMVYNPATSEVLERKITISGGSVTEASLYGTLFTCSARPSTKAFTKWSSSPLTKTVWSTSLLLKCPLIRRELALWQRMCCLKVVSGCWSDGISYVATH